MWWRCVEGERLFSVLFVGYKRQKSRLPFVAFQNKVGRAFTRNPIFIEFVSPWDVYHELRVLPRVSSSWSRHPIGDELTN